MSKLYQVEWVMYNEGSAYRSYTIGKDNKIILGLAGSCFVFYTEEDAKQFCKDLVETGIGNPTIREVVKL